MRVLWITNLPIAKHREMLNIGLAQSGGWIETSYTALQQSSKITLGIATLYDGDTVISDQDGSHSFYLVPGRKLSFYDPESSRNQDLWKGLVGDFQPDVIHIWGTEYAFGLCALKAVPEIPAVVYIQGVMSQIYRHYLDGISTEIQRRFVTFREILKNNGHWLNKGYYDYSLKVEKEILCRAKNVIVESEWCASHCYALANGCNIYKSLLPINPLFAQHNWSWEDMIPRTVFTVAGGYPIKGHHILLEAFALVLKVYPDAKLLIPGDSSYLHAKWLHRTPYSKLINNLISKNHLEKNVSFLGKLSPQQMSENIEKANVYVMPSNIENHSSSLIEAMMVGTPSISSYVGGVSEYFCDGENGFFYRNNEPEVLASLIIRIFNDKDLSIKLSNSAKNCTRKARLHMKLDENFCDIYNSILS